MKIPTAAPTGICMVIWSAVAGLNMHEGRPPLESIVIATGVLGALMILLSAVLERPLRTAADVGTVPPPTRDKTRSEHRPG